MAETMPTVTLGAACVQPRPMPRAHWPGAMPSRAAASSDGVSDSGSVRSSTRPRAASRPTARAASRAPSGRTTTTRCMSTGTPNAVVTIHPAGSMTSPEVGPAPGTASAPAPSSAADPPMGSSRTTAAATRPTAARKVVSSARVGSPSPATARVAARAPISGAAIDHVATRRTPRGQAADPPRRRWGVVASSRVGGRNRPIARAWVNARPPCAAVPRHGASGRDRFRRWHRPG